VCVCVLFPRACVCVCARVRVFSFPARHGEPTSASQGPASPRRAWVAGREPEAAGCAYAVNALTPDNCAARPAKPATLPTQREPTRGIPRTSARGRGEGVAAPRRPDSTAQAEVSRKGRLQTWGRSDPRSDPNPIRDNGPAAGGGRLRPRIREHAGHEANQIQLVRLVAEGRAAGRPAGCGFARA
jgi:hypothetical protein